MIRRPYKQIRRLIAISLVALLSSVPAMAGLTIIGSNGITVSGADGIGYVNTNGITVSGADGVLAFGPTGITVSGADAVTAGFFELRTQFYLRGNLLEQPASHAAYDATCYRRYFMGQSPSSVLAISLSLRHGMDGREPRGARSHGGLWRDPPVGRHRVLHFAMRYSCE